MTPTEPSPVDDLRRRLSQPGPWADRLRRLAADIAASDDAPPSSAEPELTCADVDAILDVIIDDELNADQLSPRVATHLKTCARCREAYALLLDTLVAESAGELPPMRVPARPTLSFLQSPLPDRPWVTRLRSALTGEAFGLTVSLNVAYLQRLFFAPQPLLVRADETPTLGPVTQLLLSDAVTVGDQLLAVELTAQRAEAHADEVALRASLSSSAPLPADLQAALTWADQLLRASVDAHGQIDFGRVSLRALQAASHDFELVVEARPELND